MSFLPIHPRAIKIFFAYSSSRKDEKLRQDLEAHLSGLKQLGVLMNWYKHQISVEHYLEYDNFKHLQTADVVVLLISPEFISLIQNEACWNNEVKLALQRHEQEEVVVIPVLLRQVHGWQRVLGDLAALPKNGIPVRSWQKLDEAFFEVAQGIEERVEELKQYQQNLQEYIQHFSNAIHQEYPLSPNSVNSLSSLKHDLALKIKDIELIEQQITTIIKEEYNQKIQQYKKDFLKKIWWGNTLNEQDRERLKSIQQHLGLKDEDVDIIEQQVTQQLSAQPMQRITKYGNQFIPKFAITTSILALAAFLGFCRPSPQTQVENFLKQGKNKFENLDYQGAANEYTKAIKIAPNNTEAYIGLGNAHFNLENDKAAVEDYTKAIDIDPKNINAFLGRGNARFSLKDYKAAIEDYTQAIRLAPDSAYAYRSRAFIRLKLRDKQGAIKDYQKAAILYAKQGATDAQKEALDWLQKLRQSPPRSSN